MTFQDHINSVIAEFDEKLKIERPAFFDELNEQPERKAWLKSFMSSHLSSSIQDFIRATEVEEKEIRFEDLDTGIGIDHLEYGGQETEKGWNAALSAQKEKIKHYLGNG